MLVPSTCHCSRAPGGRAPRAPPASWARFCGRAGSRTPSSARAYGLSLYIYMYVCVWGMLKTTTPPRAPLPRPCAAASPSNPNPTPHLLSDSVVEALEVVVVELVRSTPSSPSKGQSVTRISQAYLCSADKEHSRQTLIIRSVKPNRMGQDLIR